MGYLESPLPALWTAWAGRPAGRTSNSRFSFFMSFSFFLVDQKKNKPIIPGFRISSDRGPKIPNPSDERGPEGLQNYPNDPIRAPPNHQKTLGCTVKRTWWISHAQNLIKPVEFQSFWSPKRQMASEMVKKALGFSLNFDGVWRLREMSKKHWS